jgi:hypothetical protein
MASKVSAENVFGQVLICLRMSQLDFLVKETPYAAYITVRKKLTKYVEVNNNPILEGNTELNTKH